MINNQTKSLLDKFKEIPLFSKHKAILIGGTALAYHVSHRESFDLDICFPFSQKLPQLDFLDSFNEATPIRFDQEVIDTTINDGGDIDELMQRYIIDGVKVDFVINPSTNIYESEILKNDNKHALKHLRIIEAKKEDELDIEGIINPTIDKTCYEELKSYLLKELTSANL